LTFVLVIVLSYATGVLIRPSFNKHFWAVTYIFTK
jgi:hypothetical protein